MSDAKVFFDTPSIIYFVEETPRYLEKVTIHLAEAIRKEIHLATSILTMAEVSIKPKKIDKPHIVTKFENTLKSIFNVPNNLGGCGNICYLTCQIPFIARYGFATDRQCPSKQI